MTRLIRILWLTIIWLALWSDISIANTLSGIVVAVLIVALFDTWHDGHVIVRPIHVARFTAYFLYQLTVSSLVVAWTVVNPRDRIRSGIIAVPLLGCTDAVATLVADAVSLTPGTLTLEVRREPLTLYIHALDTRDITVLQRDIRTLEVLAVRAFGDDEALAGLVVDDTTSWRGR